MLKIFVIISIFVAVRGLPELGKNIEPGSLIFPNYFTVSLLGDGKGNVDEVDDLDDFEVIEEGDAEEQDRWADWGIPDDSVCKTNSTDSGNPRRPPRGNLPCVGVYRVKEKTYFGCMKMRERRTGKEGYICATKVGLTG